MRGCPTIPRSGDGFGYTNGVYLISASKWALPVLSWIDAAGKPGLRPEYTMPFYGAFVLDLDGSKIEAVCRKPG